MKVGVLLKQVPDTDTRIRLNGSSNGIETNDIKWVMNPYDEFALEEALKLRTAKVATEVIIISLAGASADQNIRDGLARGANRAVRLEDPAFAGSDALGRARILAAAIKAEGVELVLTGRQAIDSDQSATGAMVAEILGWSQATWVDRLQVEGKHFVADRAAGGGVRERVRGSLPAVITADKGLNTPKFATLPNIMAAKKKEIAVKNAAAIGLDVSTVGAGAAIAVEGTYSLPPARPAGKIIGGDAATAVKELVRLLRDEAKVI